MRYLCIENGRVVSSPNYEPAVPDSVQVVTITDDQYDSIMAQGTHYFDIPSRQVLPVTADMTAAKAREQQEAEARIFLRSTDWKVLRHMREQALNKPTTLSQEEYLELERKRDEAAALIR